MALIPKNRKGGETMKKLAALLLVLVMLAATCLPAFAEGEASAGAPAQTEEGASDGASAGEAAEGEGHAVQVLRADLTVIPCGISVFRTIKAFFLPITVFSSSRATGWQPFLM